MYPGSIRCYPVEIAFKYTAVYFHFIVRDTSPRDARVEIPLLFPPAFPSVGNVRFRKPFFSPPTDITSGSVGSNSVCVCVLSSSTSYSIAAQASCCESFADMDTTPGVQR